MRYYVNCHRHVGEKIYINFQHHEPAIRAEIHPLFQLTCPQGFLDNYSNREVIAEVGLAPIGAATGVGLLLSVFDPILGLLGGFLGFLGVKKAEENKEINFNNS